MKNQTFIDEEQDLLSLLRDGDKTAFNALFRRYYKPLCAYAHRFVAREDLEEIVQDLFLWIWNNHKNLEIHSSLSSYLFRAVHTRCLNKIEQNEVKQRIETLYWKNHTQYYDTSEDFQLQELLLRIHEALNRLPESYRQAFILHRFKDKSCKEIAEELAVSPKTIDYRIQKATKILREDLKDYLPLLTLLFTQN